MAAIISRCCPFAWTPLRTSRQRLLSLSPASLLRQQGNPSAHAAFKRNTRKSSGGRSMNQNSSSSPPSSSTTTTTTSSTLQLHASTTTSGKLTPEANCDPEELADISRCLPVQKFGDLCFYDLGDVFRVVFVLGGPGAGKGTQSNLIVEEYPVCHLSVGELLRNVPEDSPHCELIEQALVKGQIVPVEISLALLQRAMEDRAKVMGKDIIFLVDGFPRNFDNLSGWCRIMSHVATLSSVLVYQCPLPVLEARILERAKISGRSDDNLESVKKRFQTFKRDTMPVIEMLRKVSVNANWKVIDIRGDQSLDSVWKDTQRVMNQLVVNDILRANDALLRAVHDGDAKSYQLVCDPGWFTKNLDASEVMRKQEGEKGSVDTVANVQVDVMSGTHVAVSYDRMMQGQLLREKRIWSHKGLLGWRNVHFARLPSLEKP